MSSTMSVGTDNPSANSQSVSETSVPERTTLGQGKTIPGQIKAKFDECKNYILAHKEIFAKVAQIVGTAALIVGGASLVFAGIAANLTVGGIPLGIPLMVAGGILLGGGTVLQAMHQAEQKGLTVGEKIKGFCKETINNLKIGTIAGIALSAACAVMPLAKLVSIVPVAIKLKPYLSKDLGEKDNWNGFVGTFPENSEIRKTLEKSENLRDFIDKQTHAKEIKGFVESLENSDNKRKVSSEIKITETNMASKKVDDANPVSKDNPLVAEAMNEAMAGA